MTWRLHEGGKFQADYDRNPGCCPECERTASSFLAAASAAAHRAGRKPDDQVWLPLFGALQTLLVHRADCTLYKGPVPANALAT